MTEEERGDLLRLHLTRQAIFLQLLLRAYRHGALDERTYRFLHQMRSLAYARAVEPEHGETLPPSRAAAANAQPLRISPGE
jgi:hypothetical protein